MPELLRVCLLEKFTEPVEGSTERRSTPAQINLLVSCILVVAMHAAECFVKVPCDTFARQLGMHEKKMVTAFKAIGCTVQGGKRAPDADSPAQRLATLQMPLKFPMRRRAQVKK